MTPERWQRVKEVVGFALDLHPPDRPALLDMECAGDPLLRSEVETLLRQDEIESAVLELDRVPATIGRYRVVRELGSGGMGTVYLGERADGEYEQQVAIKVIKRGMDSASVLRRFYAERQILARLAHPNITRLLDGGMYENRPFFVMEYLQGEPILDYCRIRNLSSAARIDLFRMVCEAVDYAHRSLILHRDLKSSNILIQPDGTPKLLDFGIARLLESDSAEETAFSARALTPAYASPEQVRGEPLTTASDVYSLGVLLRELLTGLPFRADLQNILLKALENDPLRRYQTAAQLSEDLSRYSRNLPVQARPNSVTYRAGKFIRRHRSALGLAAVMTLAISLAMANAVREGRRANRRFQQVRELANSFLFEFHDAITPLPGSTPARELVVKRALQYLNSLATEATGDEGLQHELAVAYERVGNVQGSPFEPNLGHQADAKISYEKALGFFTALARSHPKDRQASLDRAEAQLHLAALLSLSDPAGCIKLNRETIALVGDSPAGSQAQLTVALAWFGIAESEIALKHPRESIEARMKSQRLLSDLVARDPKNRQAQRFFSQSQKRIAAFQIGQTHEYAKAIAGLQTAIAIDQKRTHASPPDPTAKLDLTLGQYYLARAQLGLGDSAAAIASLETSIRGLSEVLTADPRNYRARVLLIGYYTRLGTWLEQAGRVPQSRAAWKEGLALTAPVTEFAQNTPEMAEAISALRRTAKLP